LLKAKGAGDNVRALGYFRDGLEHFI
jgi:hypothetical protein